MISAASSLSRGNTKAAAQKLAFVGRSFSQDAQSGALKTAATARLAQMLKKPR